MDETTRDPGSGHRRWPALVAAGAALVTGGVLGASLIGTASAAETPTPSTESTAPAAPSTPGGSADPGGSTGGGAAPGRGGQDCPDGTGGGSGGTESSATGADSL